MLIEKKLAIKNKLGLHARPAALFVQSANKFDSEITVKKGEGSETDAKSILGVLTLAAGFGSEILVKAEGEDAQTALDELEKLIEGKFGEE
jgi:phosphotransferase system HPr (HPr) family protein